MNKQRGGTWFVYLFLSIFVIVGSGCLLYAPVKLVQTALFIRSATTTSGTVVDFHASRGSESTTYAPEVAFTAPDGSQVRFRSRISSGSPDYGIGQQVPVYFDPARPDRAEIHAFIPLWMPVIILSALGLAFTGIGGGMMVALRRGAREARRKEAAQQQGLKEWEADPAWRSGAIRSVTRQEMWFFWLFAMVWNAIGQPAGFIAVREFIKGNRLAAIGLMFPVAGIWLLSVAIRKTLQVRRFGEILLRMDPFPGSLGGEVGGTVELPVPFRPGNSFAVSLSCLRVTRRNNGTSQELLWQETGRAAATAGSDGTRAAFRFAVPATLPASSDDPLGSHQWVVRLTADLPGIDLDRSFVIPVAAADTPQMSGIAVAPAPDLDPPRQIPAGIVTIEQQPDRLLLRYPPRRNLKNGLVLAFVGGWFLFFTWIFVVKGAGPALIILPIFGLIGLALLLYAVWLFGYSLQVAASAGELIAVRRFIGIPVTTARVPVSSVQEVEAVRFGARGSGSAAQLIFSVAARLADGKRITVGDGIDGRQNAEALARMIARQCGRGGVN